MSSLSNQVLDLENKLVAYGKVFWAMKDELECLDFECIDENVFNERISYFKELSLNRALARCPYPNNCRFYEKCTESKCNYNECNNGYPMRRS